MAIRKVILRTLKLLFWGLLLQGLFLFHFYLYSAYNFFFSQFNNIFLQGYLINKNDGWFEGNVLSATFLHFAFPI